MTGAKPSLALLRGLSDEAVLRALMDAAQLTRAELAVTTGLSKPTVAEAVRRLELGGLVRDTGLRTRTRGGVGTYYALADDIGVALAVSIAPEGVALEVLNAAGVVLAHTLAPLARPARPAAVADVLARLVPGVLDGRPARAAVVSAADPVDKRTGELVHLPDAPFLLGAMSPPDALARLIDGPVLVDNDVNWAARAERSTRTGQDPGSVVDDFAYLYLGEGIGCAIVTDGEVRRGHRGLAGEVGHVLVRGADGRAVPLTQLFGHLGLRHHDSTAIDVGRLLAALRASDGAVLARTLGGAVADVLDAVVALADPAFVVVGGSWGADAALLEELRRQVARHPRPVKLELPVAGDQPFLAGARAAAVQRLRADIITRSHDPQR